MKCKVLSLLAVLAALLVVPSERVKPLDAAAAGRLPGFDFSRIAGLSPDQRPAACFAPDTTEEYVRDLSSSGALHEQISFFQVNDNGRWSSTASNGGGLVQGDPTVLTWGVVADGLQIPSGIGEPASPSNLRAFLTNIYPGGPAQWLPIFEQIFGVWGELTGITYVYEPNDDGAPFLNSQGVVGVRADLRVGGHFIDGNSNVLAYNYFPNNGDMVIDTGDNFYNNTTNNSIRMRNVLAHEHGHGMGISHVCPVQQTKLMEPFVTVAFDGPQHDDILSSNRLYGDALEPNDTAGTASDLGILGPDSTDVDTVSVDGSTDVDYFAFEVTTGGLLSVTMSPVGFTYLEGPQMTNGNCTPGTSFNTLTLSNLGFQVRASNGTTVLATVDNNGVGIAETLTDFSLSSAGTYYLRVIGLQNQAQIYNLSASFEPVLVCMVEDLIPSWNLVVLPCLGRAPNVQDIIENL